MDIQDVMFIISILFSVLANIENKKYSDYLKNSERIIEKITKNFDITILIYLIISGIFVFIGLAMYIL